MRYSSQDLEFEAWVEDTRASAKFPEHREEWTRDEKTGQGDGLRQAYLEMENGKTFAIKFRCLRPGLHPDLEISTSVDGRRVSGLAWLGKHSDTKVDHMFVQHDGVAMAADLTFAALPTTDEQHLATLQGQAIDLLCKIEVIVRRGTLKNLPQAPGMRQPSTITESKVGVIHEKAKKLGSTIQGSNMRKPTPTNLCRFIPAKVGADVCRFVWKYHTRPQLSLMGIVEDEPLPAAPVLAVQAPAVANVPAMSSLAAFAAQLNSGVKHESLGQSEGAEGSVKRVKREQMGTGQNQPVVITEGGPKRQAVNRTGVKAQVIDLTLDD